MGRVAVKRKAMPFAPCARAPRILLRQCDNEAVVHNKEKSSKNHNPDSIT